MSKEIQQTFIIDNNDKHYPDANAWMWDYCVFLGKFTDSNGKNYDLGIFEGSQILDATVYDNKPGSYSSGEMADLNYYIEQKREAFIECHRRAKLLGLIPDNFRYRKA